MNNQKLDEAIEKFIELGEKITRITTQIDSPNVHANIEKTLKRCAQYGWTITSNQPLNGHLHDIYTEEEINQYFTNLYKEDDGHLFNVEKKYILENVSDHYINLVEECFKNYDENNFLVIIPALITIIEGEISFVTSKEKNKSLPKTLHSTLSKSGKEPLEVVIESSAASFFKDYLFKGHTFEHKRLPILNRHWILHGRDNPNLWTRMDALKLIVNLSTIIMITSREAE